MPAAQHFDHCATSESGQRSIAEPVALLALRKNGSISSPMSSFHVPALVLPAHGTSPNYIIVSSSKRLAILHHLRPSKDPDDARRQ
jgi:hypothetical protein